MEPEDAVRPITPEDEDDVEGQAFTWKVVDDPKAGGKHLRAGWTPDDPKAARPRDPGSERKDTGQR
jgi:hypothetical protein